MHNNVFRGNEKITVLKLITLILIMAVLCVIIAFLLIAIAKEFARKPYHTSDPEHTEAFSETDAETEYEWDSEMLFYFDITRFNTAYGMNQLVASEPYLDRYDAVADQLKDAKATLEVLDPQSEEYAEILAEIRRCEQEQDQIHKEWESMNDEVTEHYMGLLQLICEKWELDFEEWTNHLDELITFEPGKDMSVWQ